MPDTHFLLWMAVGDRRAKRAAAFWETAETEVFFSVASLWEVAVKYAQGRPDFRQNPIQLRADCLAAGFAELPIEADHVFGVLDLPIIHRDPFDRLLVSQARAEGLTLLTSDETLALYPGDIRRV